jgi:rod shape determining protein RodA
MLPALIPAFLVWTQLNDYQRLLQEYGPQEGRRVYAEKAYPLGIALEPHQLDRIMMFREPERDRKGKGYHAIQARITVGSGEFLGKGFGQGTQTHLNFLPEFHNDFIVALLAEEWGFMGAATVVLLFALLTVRGLRIAEQCPDFSGSLIALGCTIVLAFHAFANLAITVGLLPVTGMPLPFLSYGGSFYITTAVCCGLILAVHVQRKPLAMMRRSKAVGLA